jgi:putative OPT family oligopeptide transporter
MQWVLAVIVLSIIPLFLLYHFLIGHFALSFAMAVIMVVAGFLFSAVSGYMTGLVGSSNNPISGVTIATILFASLLILFLFGSSGNDKGAAAAILIGAVVACAAAIAGDNLHDLKTGYILGATPWKQQLMLIIGTVTSALVMAPVLNLLLHAYGIGPATALHPESLTAPQATLMAAVSRGVFQGGLPWGIIVAGMVLAVVIIAVDLRLERRGSSFRAPVLAIAIGIYLPFELSVPIFLGGIISYLVRRRLKSALADPESAEFKAREQRGMLISSGLITGEALVGILMAIPIVVAGRSDVLAFLGVHDLALPGILLLLGLFYVIYRRCTAGLGPAR